MPGKAQTVPPPGPAWLGRAGGLGLGLVLASHAECHLRCRLESISEERCARQLKPLSYSVLTSTSGNLETLVFSGPILSFLFEGVICHRGGFSSPVSGNAKKQKL